MSVKLKGKMIIGQSGGPTVVINRSLVGAVIESLNHKEITEVYGMLNGIDGILKDNIIDLKKETKKTLMRVADTPAAALGSCRHKPSPEECELIFDKLQKLDIRYFFYIGGNDTAETAHILSSIAMERKYDIRFFHIPKTIDNDLRETDHCPGYASAAKYVALSFIGNNFDNYSLPGIKIDVVMGRNAGWLTAAAALARMEGMDGPHLIYIPEKPVTLNRFCEEVLSVYENYGRALVAVSEGLKTPDGKLILEGQIKEQDSHGNLQLSGSGMLGDFLVEQVKKAWGKKLRIRSDTLGYAQRSFHGVRSMIDAEEAWNVGKEAVRYAVSGKERGSVIIERISNKPYKSKISFTELSKVAKVTRDLPLNFINEKGNDVTSDFIEYLKPLVGELPPAGLLKRVPVK